MAVAHISLNNQLEELQAHVKHLQAEAGTTQGGTEKPANLFMFVAKPLIRAVHEVGQFQILPWSLFDFLLKNRQISMTKAYSSPHPEDN